jgi:hypothetical protein
MSQTPIFDQLRAELKERGLVYENLIKPIQVELPRQPKMRGVNAAYAIVDEFVKASVEELEVPMPEFDYPQRLGLFMNEAVKQMREFQAEYPDGVFGTPEIIKEEDGSYTWEQPVFVPPKAAPATVKRLQEKNEPEAPNQE